MQAVTRHLSTKPSPTRRVISVPANVTAPQPDSEITLESFRQLLLELTGRRVSTIAETTPQSHPAVAQGRRRA